MTYLDIFEFNALSREEKISYLYDHCTFLVQRKENPRTRVNLYSAGNFFVELSYDTLTHRLGHVHSFNHTEVLEPYLEHLSFPALFEV
jgi:hypothetical protein